MVDRRRRSVRTALVAEALRVALAGRAQVDPEAGLDIVDLGGGTGGFAVPLAREATSCIRARTRSTSSRTLNGLTT